MPFYLRKSVKAGPFRFNLSNSGLGMSVGVKGLRIGTGPRGHYVRAGRGGVYYQASLGRVGGGGSSKSPVAANQPAPVTFAQHPGVHMVEVESGDVAAMREEAFGHILDEINAKQRQWRKSSVFSIVVLLLGIAAISIVGQAGAAVMLLALPAWVLGRWVDSYRRTTVLCYSLDQVVESSFQALASSFDEMAACGGKWHVEAGGAVRDLTTWKRNAGASHIVRKKPTSLTYKLPEVIKSNVTPPAIQVGRQMMYFFPDVVLIEDKGRIGAVGYGNLQMKWQESNFIEEGSVPRDAQVVGHVWAHPNKNGGPDRRFKNNRQIPLCRYEALHFSSNSGINELIELSRTGLIQRFASAVGLLPRMDVQAITALEEHSII